MSSREINGYPVCPTCKDRNVFYNFCAICDQKPCYRHSIELHWIEHGRYGEYSKFVKSVHFCISCFVRYQDSFKHGAYMQKGISSLRTLEEVKDLDLIEYWSNRIICPSKLWDQIYTEYEK